MKYKFFVLVLIIISAYLPSICFAQTPEQRRQLDQINRDIAADEHDIAVAQAKSAVTDFFINKFGYVHQTNLDCLATFKKIESYAASLPKPDLFTKTYTTSEEAYAALEVLANVQISEDITLNKIVELQEYYEIQKQNINSMKEFLTFGQDWVIHRFPVPDDVNDRATYQATLWNEYHKIVTEHGDKLKYYISKCGNSDFDIRPSIDKRRGVYQAFYDKLTSFYLQAYQKEYADRIESKYKPSENTRLMLAVTSAFNTLDREYRNAVMLEYDYFKAISIIDSYPDLSAIILAKAAPRELNPDVRLEAQGEIQRRIATANNFKKIIQKEKPSYWLNKRYVQVKKSIDSHQINCSDFCRKNLDQVPSLIHASQILEDVSNETIYAVLGYQALDLANGR